MSRDQDWYDVLTEAAKTCGVDLSFIHSILKDHGTAIASWVDQNLNNASLLTREEILIWQFIKKSKAQLHRNEKTRQNSNMPLHEKDLQDIVSGLQAQTKTVRAKSQVLRSQLTLVATHDNTHDDAVAPETLYERAVEKQWEQQSQQIFFVNEDSKSHLSDKIRLNQEKLEKCLRTVDSAVKEKLRTDDRILDTLETLISSNSLRCFADQPASQLKTDALQRAVMLSLKTRLDRVYLNELAKDIDVEHDETPDALKQIQLDLQSLYTEIEAVAGMLVRKELGSRLEAVEENLALLAKEAMAQDIQKITNEIAKLVESTHQLTARYRHLQACRVVSGEIQQLYSQAQTQTHATASYKQGFKKAPIHPAPITLLRHLGIDHKDTGSSTECTAQLQELSLADLQDDILTLDRILTDTRVSTSRIHLQLQELLKQSRGGSSTLTGLNRMLDERISMAKAKLETTPEGSETITDGRRRFINAYLHA